MKQQDDFELKRALDALPRSIEPPADAWPEVRARLRKRRPRAWAWPEAFEPRTLRIAAGIGAIGIGLAVLAAQTRAGAQWYVSEVVGNRFVTDARAVQPGETFATGAGTTLRARWRPELRPFGSDADLAVPLTVLRIGSIGRVELAAHTRVRQVAARVFEHRLALERGMIHAKIDAPPRLFIVETPAGTAFDMGCEYTLHVDSAGNSVLHVDVGWVEFEDRGRESLVPADFMLISRPGGRVGIPIHEDASNQVRYAVRLIEDGGSLDSAVAILAAYALRRDAVTLWHAMRRVDGDHRELFHDILRRLQPPPTEVTYEGAMALDPIMLRL